MAATTIIVKITLGTEIRRFTSNSDTLSWTDLKKDITKLFELSNKCFKLTYTDDEGDRITLSTDSELKEAKSLALTASPAVLRLTVLVGDDKPGEDAPTRDAASTTEEKPTTDKNKKATHDEPLATFLESMAKQLPAVVAQMPEAVRNMMPHAELDVAATIAANAADNASCIAAEARRAASVAAAAATAAYHHSHNPNSAAMVPPVLESGDPPIPGAHAGVTCDKSGMSPIVGNRYHLVGHNYDLCEAEFMKLCAKEQALFHKVPPPTAQKPIDATGNANATHGTANGNGAGNGNGGNKNNVHPGVECDASGMNPIIGTRYNLRGHNYDLCQAEFDKLSEKERALYDAIPPPKLGGGMGMGGCGFGGGWRQGNMGGGNGNFGMGNGFGMGGRGWNRCGGGMGGNGMGNGMGCGGMMGGHAKLAARFVRDVSIFDGTQMEPGQNFTKIWRLKNVGEVPWPPGTRMLFVGGDQMTEEMSVPLSRGGPVMPGEEVDVAVEMKAPSELGRYLGYWRLTGPYMRRKFGQRVWCHVQVVDPSAEVSLLPADDADLDRTLAEIEQKKTDLALSAEPGEEAEEALADEADVMTNGEPEKAEKAEKAETAVATTEGEPLTGAVKVDGAVETHIVAADGADKNDKDKEAKKDDDDDDDGDIEPPSGKTPSDDEFEKIEAPGAAATTTAPASAEDKVKAQLLEMGFADAGMLAAVVAKHGADVEACARALAAASEWEGLLDSLAEMGFANRELNQTLMLKHSGNMKRTVKELIDAEEE